MTALVVGAVPDPLLDRWASEGGCRLIMAVFCGIVEVCAVAWRCVDV